MFPPLDDDLFFFQAVEDFVVEQFVAQFCCDIPASRQAIGVEFPCDIDTSMWRSSLTICSAAILFFGMTSSFSSSFSHKVWFKKARSDQRSGQSIFHPTFPSITKTEFRTSF